MPGKKKKNKRKRNIHSRSTFSHPSSFISSSTHKKRTRKNKSKMEAIATERALATVDKIRTVEAIPGADRIECATVRNWNVVVRKGEFQPGDICVYFEIDSMLPLASPIFSFLAKDSKAEYHRLKTVCMRGQISQGLCIPIAAFTNVEPSMLEVGSDLTAVLGIRKYMDDTVEDLLPNAVNKGVPFPVHLVPKTEAERIQNIDDAVLERLVQNHRWYATEKVDGTSMTVILRGDNPIMVCSRNQVVLPDTDNYALYGQAVADLQIEAWMRDAGLVHHAVQGELVAPRVQGNLYAVNRARFFVFGIFDIQTQTYLSLAALLSALGRNGCLVESVPLLEENVDFSKVSRRSGLSHGLLTAAEGKSKLNPKAEREGIVYRRVDEHTISCKTNRTLFKVISNRFLLLQR
jgi:RNA ligase (TIGR02306 family)